MAIIAMNPYPFFSQETMTDPLAQQLKNHIWKRFNYVLTQSDAEEIMFTDMWSSIEEFIEYMQQDGVGQPIPSMTNYKPLPPGRLYTTQELDAMDAAILPLDYGLHDQRMIDMNLDTILVGEDDDEYDSDVDSIYIDYDGEPLPRYQSVKLPIYEYLSPPPSYHSNVSGIFDLDPMVEEPMNLSTDLPLTTAQEAKPKSRRHNMFSKLRPRLTDKIKKLREKISSSKKEPRAKKGPPDASSESLPKRVPTAHNLTDQLRIASPKRAIKGFFTLARFKK
ncbi:hypothetical protein GGR58DRAFT_520114 [Xylaria digitata]|nr:hypothetical protein GGR58DRAFT_520114 [Xylaria digitata]